MRDATTTVVSSMLRGFLETVNDAALVSVLAELGEGAQGPELVVRVERAARTWLLFSDRGSPDAVPGEPAQPAGAEPLPPYETVEAERDAARAEVERLRLSKAGAYWERDRLVCVLSKMWPASLERHPEIDADWEDDWRWIVYIKSPVGQLSWHIHDSELPEFAHLPRAYGVQWDGHTTQEKYDRLSRLAIGEAAEEDER